MPFTTDTHSCITLTDDGGAYAMIASDHSGRAYVTHLDPLTEDQARELGSALIYWAGLKRRARDEAAQ